MLARALVSRCEQAIHLCFTITMCSQQTHAWILSLSGHVPLLLFTHPLLPQTKLSDPAARAHTQTNKSSFAFSQILPLLLGLSLFFTHRHTTITNPHPSHHKSWRHSVLPPPLLGIWRKQCWQSPPPNCSTCSTWPHMFSFLTHNKLPKSFSSSLDFGLTYPASNQVLNCMV